VWEKKKCAFRAMVRAVVSDPNSVEDVLQEAFLRVLKTRKSFANGQEAFNYLRRTVLNTSIDSYRRLKRQNSRFDTRNGERYTQGYAEIGNDPLSLLLTTEAAEMHNQLVTEVERALRTLQPKQREAVEAFFRRESTLKLKEFCQEQGVPYSTLRSRMLQGIDQIRIQLQARGVSGFVQTEEKPNGLRKSKTR
jgi:RNA polymerase sigma-70 factor (ECF subfamily)